MHLWRRQVGPYIGTALVLALLTGFSLFASEAVRIGNGSAFQYKMLLLCVALLLHFTIHRKATSRESEGMTGLHKLAGGLSIGCWLGVAFAGRAIGFGFL